MRQASTATSTDLTETLARLQGNVETIDWPERCRIVSQIAGPLAQGMAGDPFRALLLILAEDPKWEVRKEVAEVVGDIPDIDLTLLAERFLSDSHTYVRQAARQSIQRREKAIQKARKKKWGIELVLALYQELEAQYGKKAAEKARRMAEQLYDLQVAATVHEMRSVLTALKGTNAHIMERQDNDTLEPAILKRMTQRISQRLGFLERMLEDMRAYARPVPEDRVAVPVADLLTEVRSIVSENLKARGITTRRVKLEVAFPPGLELKVSRTHIVAAMVNLLKNAYEALPSVDNELAGNIRLQVLQKPRAIHILIEDEGRGIPAGDLAEVRQCLPGRTSKQGHGTGFGLCIARRNIEAHGGRLQIESQEMHGTKVTLVMPAN